MMRIAECTDSFLPVVDGVGFFLNIVLPFNTQYLRPLCFGYFFAISALLVSQLILSKFSEQKAAEATEVNL